MHQTPPTVSPPSKAVVLKYCVLINSTKIYFVFLSLLSIFSTTEILQEHKKGTDVLGGGRELGGRGELQQHFIFQLLSLSL